MEIVRVEAGEWLHVNLVAEEVLENEAWYGEVDCIGHDEG